MSPPSKRKRASKFDRYAYYCLAVQSPKEDVAFLHSVFSECFGSKRPTWLREDFCGTFTLCCHWVQSGKRLQAIGLDLDAEPLDYGKANHLSALKTTEQKRVQVRQQNVLDPKPPAADIVTALNFSFFVFKQRPTLLRYFKNCYQSLNSPGLMVVDCFGGPAAQRQNEDRTPLKGFTYYWEQLGYNPITQEAKFQIHFRLDNQKRVEGAFHYDWRLWSLPEIRDLLLEAGFQKTHVYWEGTTRNGEGNGIFKRSEIGDDAESWVAYVVAEKR